jgi:hypothetical protein
LQWRHAGTTRNPTDLASRDLSVHELIGNKLWLERPDFFKFDKDKWPENLLLVNQLSDNDPEVKRNDTAITP